MAKISVVMATYNGEKYILEQLNSILSQTYYVDEIVVVDDSSTDSTFSILSSLCSTYSQIKLFRNDINIGVRKTFEKALICSTGDFIALSDQDDVWFSNKIEVLIHGIGSAMLAHSDSMIVDSELNIISRSHFRSSKKLKKVTFFDYLVNSNITGCTMLIRRELLSVCLPFSTYSLPHDWYLAYYAAYKNAIIFINQPLMLYRQHSSNVSGFRKKSYDEYLDSNKEVARGIKDILIDSYFNDNQDALFMVRYKESIYNNTLLSLSDVVYLLKKKSIGVKLLFLFFIIVIPPKKMKTILYNQLRKFV